MTTHDWETVRMTRNGQPIEKTGRRCQACGVVTYRFYDALRWRYPNGSTHETHTVDEPTCTGQARRDDCQ